MWSSSVSDDALLAGLASGDRAAATAFVRRFQGRVYGLALTIVRQPAIAEEFVDGRDVCRAGLPTPG